MSVLSNIIDDQRMRIIRNEFTRLRGMYLTRLFPFYYTNYLKNYVGSETCYLFTNVDMEILNLNVMQ